MAKRQSSSKNINIKKLPAKLAPVKSANNRTKSPTIKKVIASKNKTNPKVRKINSKNNKMVIQTFLSNVRAGVRRPVTKKVEPKKPTSKLAKKDTRVEAEVTKPTREKRGFRLDRKVVLPLLGLLLIAVLAYAASRYLVVAWVDKKPITRFEFYTLLEKRYGKDLREQLIVQKLVQSEANKRHVSVSDAEVKAEITKIESQQGGAQQLDQALQAQGIDRNDLQGLVKLQLLRDKMFGGGSTVTEDDINKYIEDNKASMPQTDPNNASATSQLRESVKNQLAQQKVTTNFNTWLQSQLSSSRVIRL